MKDWRGNYEHLSVHHLMGHQRTGCWMKPRARQPQNHSPCPRARSVLTIQEGDMTGENCSRRETVCGKSACA